jgi:uncharacterized protein (TIGR02145 family)
MKQVYHFLMILFIICFTTNIYSQSVPSYVPTNGLVGWWGFNGNAQDGSGNGNHGTVNGATLTTDRFGNQNGAYFFNHNDEILTPFNAISGRQPRTFSFWMKNQYSNKTISPIWYGGYSGSPVMGDAYRIFFNRNEQSDQCGCWPTTYEGIGIYSNWVNSIRSTVVGDNQWHNWVVVLGPLDSTFNQIQYYKNGSLITSSIIFDYNNNGNSNINTINQIALKFGKSLGTFPDRAPTEYLDDIGIWNRALTQQEITNLYNSQLPTQTSLCLPTITTITPTSIGIDSVVIGGDILNDGGSSIVLRGVCYSTTPNPNLGNPRTEEGSGIGSFTSILRNLSPSTTYYARSYAKNSQGVVVYGNEVSFSTGTPVPSFLCGTSTVTDVDGNYYNTVQIGNQCWTQSNLKVSKYRNGDSIPTGLSNTAWQNTTAGAYAIYDNNPVNDGLYGKLYNHYAVMDTRGLCPTGWHVPTDGEWNLMVKFLDPNADTICNNCPQSGIAGGALKSTATQPTPGGWASPNGGATNSSGFTAGPGGLRGDDGNFAHLGFGGYYWSSSSSSGSDAWFRSLNFGFGGGIHRYNPLRPSGFSVRCLRDFVGGGTSMVIPTVTTASVTAVTATSANTGGDVTQDGGAPVTARGVAYGTSSSPTTSGSITNDGTGTGVYTSTLVGLTFSTTYYVRAYATNSVGTAYGNEVTFTTSPLSIGMSYAGGIIFHLDSTGQHGMVCAPVDQGNYEWGGCNGTAIPNTSTAVGSGATNTASIMAGCGQRPIAASVCADLVLNGYSDWYLPSSGELQLMYNRLHLQGLGGFGGSWYWSSSQFNTYHAWYLDRANGGVYYYYKNYDAQVRAVRTF